MGLRPVLGANHRLLRWQKNYWLADGFHRVAAAKKGGLNEVEVEVRQGGQRDAILFSAGANATHGYLRSNEDKRRAVFRLLNDPEWSKWADREIARRCSVTPTLVGKLRASLSTVDSEQTERTYKTRHGTVARMQTSAIGKPPVQSYSRVASNVPKADKAQWSLPENASGGVFALARYRGLILPGSETNAGSEPGTAANPETLTVEPTEVPRTLDVVAEPLGESRSDLTADLGNCSGARVSHGKRTYSALKRHLDGQGPRPSLPSQHAIKAMTAENRAIIRKLAEQSRAWTSGLLDLLNNVAAIPDRADRRD